MPPKSASPPGSGADDDKDIPFFGFAMPAREPALPPLPSPGIVGRDDDLRRVVTAITDRVAPVLTILGPLGVGKTRLALTAAWELVDAFRDGVAFVALTNDTPGELWETVARALGIAPPTGDTWLNALIQNLSSREMLLVLDDCEHVDDASTDIPSIVAQCPDLVILATSQHPLQIEIEQEIWLRPLDLPKATSSPGEAAVSSAVQLFASRARHRNPSFVIDDHNAADVAAIVRLLDGLPLAIELAAGQTRHFTPAELRHQLERSLPSLASAARDLPERHRSLLNMTIWSLNRLHPADRRRFLRLSILEDEFPPNAAFQTMDVSEIEGWELLTSFADKSLVTRAPGTSSCSTGAPRFSILQTLRAGAQHLLQQDTDEYAHALHNRASAYVTLARDAARDWHGPRYIAAFQTVDRDEKNIDAIIESALTTPALAKQAIALADPMFWYWLTRNRASWILPRLETILTNAPDNAADRPRGVAHFAAGWFAIRQNQTHRAAWHYREGNRLIPDPTDPAALRGAIGQAYLLRNMDHDPAAGIALLRRTIDLAASRPDAWYELSIACYSLGLHLFFSGDATEARNQLNEALRIARAYSDTQSIAMNLIHIAQIDRMARQHTDALHKIQEALPVLEGSGDISNILLGLDIAVMVIEELGDRASASRLAVATARLRQTSRIHRLPEVQEIIGPTLRRLSGSTDTNDPSFSDHAPSFDELVNLVVAWKPPATSRPPSSPLAGILSDRELEILYMIADGKTSPQIAAELFVSRHTVKRHMANIRAKLGVRSQAAAVAMLQHGR